MTTITQCRSCPWRTDCDPARDIPNGYSVAKHQALKCTIAEPGPGSIRAGAAMACHYSAVGDERPCAGWLNHQLGPGNNIGVRFAVLTGKLPGPIVVGPQHATFEATLPKKVAKVKARRYCELCDRWVATKECPACGADTVPAAKPARA